MQGRWSWFAVVATIAAVFASGQFGFLPPDVAIFASAIGALATTGLAVVDGLASKTLNTLTAIGAFVATALTFTGVLPTAIGQFLTVAAAIIAAVTTLHPAAKAARLRKYGR